LPVGRRWQLGVVGDRHCSDTNHVTDHLNAYGLTKKLAGDRAEGNPSRCFTSTRTFKNWSGIGKPVLLHAG
jgi:hypothetical protein